VQQTPQPNEFSFTWLDTEDAKNSLAGGAGTAAVAFGGTLLVRKFTGVVRNEFAAFNHTDTQVYHAQEIKAALNQTPDNNISPELYNGGIGLAAGLAVALAISIRNRYQQARLAHEKLEEKRLAWVNSTVEQEVALTFNELRDPVAAIKYGQL
jgi:hypothetical protein